MTRAAATCALFIVVASALISLSGAPAATDVPGAARKVLYYVDPMHPAFTSDRPGTAPDCGMPLVAVYEDADAASVRVRPEIRRVAGVQVQTVAKTSITSTLR